MSCPFCNQEIIQKQHIMIRDDVNVLYSIRPGKNLGRCLVIPVRHVPSLSELTQKEAEMLFGVVWEVSRKLKAELKPIAMNYGFNEGRYAGQSVEHFHFHIMPRYKKDDMPEFHLFHRPDNAKKNLSEEEMHENVMRFRQILR